MEELVTALKEICREFRAWWEQHEVEDWSTGKVIFEHPVYGQLAFEYMGFQIADRHYSELMVFTFIPLDGTGTAAKLEVVKQA